MAVWQLLGVAARDECVVAVAGDNDPDGRDVHNDGVEAQGGVKATLQARMNERHGGDGSLQSRRSPWRSHRWGIRCEIAEHDDKRGGTRQAVDVSERFVEVDRRPMLPATYSF